MHIQVACNICKGGVQRNKVINLDTGSSPVQKYVRDVK